MEHSGNQVQSVVALLAVFGSRTAEDLAAATLSIHGLKAWRSANVSSSAIIFKCIKQWIVSVLLFVSLTNYYVYNLKQPRRPPALDASNAVPSRNLGKAVVVVAAVLGLETAEVLGKPS